MTGQLNGNGSSLGKAPIKVRLATTSLAGCFGCHMSISRH